MQFGAVARRAGFDPVTTVAALGAVALALVLVAAGPIYSDAVTVAALRRSLADAPVRDTSITVSTSSAAGDFDALDEIVERRIRRATGATGADVSRRLGTASYDLDIASDDELVPLAIPRAVEGAEERVTIVAGAWPTGDATVAIDVRSAERLGLDVGDSIELTRRREPDQVVAVTLGGTYEITDPTDRFWADDERLLAGVTESVSFRTWTLLVDPAFARRDPAARFDVDWFVQPALDGIDLTAARSLRGAASRFEADLAADLAAASENGTVPVGTVEVDTRLSGALADADRSLTVTRSSVLAVTLQLSLLAGYALAFTASLVAEGRRAELELLRARGASPRQLLGRSSAEAALLTVPTAAVAPIVAVLLVGSLDRIGPLARTGLAIDPSTSRTSYVLVAVAAIVTIVLLSAPTYRLARAAQRASDGRRERSRSGAQRAGVDLAVTAVAGVALWQLATLGDERTASIRGRFGVDPLLVVAPALGLFSGAFLALRVVPLLARLAEQLAVTSRSAVPALAGWSVARRPGRYARAALLLIIAVALGVFTATFEASWERSQLAQATQQVGADARVLPNRRSNDSIDDLQLLAAYRGVAGVAGVMPVVRRVGSLPNAARPVQLLAVDAVAAAEVMLAGRDGELATALRSLAEGRPADEGGLLLPDGTSRVELALRVTDPPPPPPAPVDTADDDAEHEGDVAGEVAHEYVPVTYDVALVVRDGDGLHHRIGAGAVTAETGDVVLTIDLMSDRAGVVPAPPVRIDDIELRADVPFDRNRVVNVHVARIDAIDRQQTRHTVGTSRWSVGQDVVGPVDERTSATVQVVDGAPAVDITTGRSQFGARVTYAIRAMRAAPPSTIGVVVSRSWADENAREIGDLVPIPALSDRSIRIVGTVTDVPTVDPRSSLVVLADLPTLQSVDAEIGAPFVSIDEVWLAADDAAAVPAVSAELRRPPYEAVDVIGRDELARRLRNDPPAVGTIGALTLGFVAASVFAVVGFLLAATVSARDRAGEFALLRAVGLTGRQLANWTLVEQLALIVVGLLLGTGIGLGLSAAVLPSTSLTAAGDEVYPPVEMVVPWTTILTVHAVVVIGLATAVVGINAVLRRLAVARQLRAGAT